MSKNLIIGLLLGIALMSAQTVFAQDWKSDWSKFPNGAKAVCNDNSTDIDNDDDGLIELCFLENLDAIRYMLDGSGYKASASATTNTMGCPSSGCIGYELVRDLDFADDDSYSNSANQAKWATTSTGGWLPIGGGDNPFTAIFEGNGHTLSHLTIYRLSNEIALFGRQSGGTINGIGLLDVNVHGGTEVGSLVGYSLGKISNSYSTGQVNSAGNILGGLVGLAARINNNIRNEIRNSYSKVQVSSRGNDVGGLVGQVLSAPVIANCYSTGRVRGSTWIGGLCGSIVSHTLSNSYSTSQVRGTSSVGGLVGITNAFSNINYSYSTGDPLIGRSFVSPTIMINNSGKKTHTELQTPTTNTGIYSNWNPADWDFGTNTQYPAIRYNSVGSYTACGESQQPACGHLLPGQGRIQVVISDETAIRAQASEGDAVVLDATRGGNATYQWSQIGSDSLGLDSANAAILRFVVPSDLVRRDAKTQDLTLQLKAGSDRTTTISIVVKKINNGSMTATTITRSARRLIPMPGMDPDGAVTIQAYLWQKCSANDCSLTGEWQRVSGNTTGSSYQIPDDEAVENIQFRVQLSYRDGQGYQEALPSAPLTYINQKPTVKNADHQVVVTLGTTVNKQILTTVFEDADGDALRYTAAGLPPNSNLMLSEDGRLMTSGDDRIVGSATTNTASAIPVVLTATDNSNSTATTTFKLFFNAETSGTLTITASNALSYKVADANGITNQTYQWYKHDGSDFVALAGETRSTYTPPLNKEARAAGTRYQVIAVVTDRIGQRTTLSTVHTIRNQAPMITDIGPIATTEGEVVRLVVMLSDFNLDNLNYAWRVTTGDKTPSILVGNLPNSSTLVFTVPNNWTSTTQTTLILSFSVSDGVTTSTKPVTVNIARSDNGGLITTPKISINDENRLEVRIDLADPDGVGAIQNYQWQICTNDCDDDKNWAVAPKAQSTASYLIQEDAVEGSQFRVQITYRDGQGYVRTVTPVYNYRKAIFMRLKLFLEGALQ